MQILEQGVGRSITIYFSSFWNQVTQQILFFISSLAFNNLFGSEYVAIAKLPPSPPSRTDKIHYRFYNWPSFSYYITLYINSLVFLLFYQDCPFLPSTIIIKCNRSSSCLSQMISPHLSGHFTPSCQSGVGSSCNGSVTGVIHRKHRDHSIWQ